MPLQSILLISIIGGIIIIMVILYGVMWWLARSYRNKNQLHGDSKDYIIKEKGEKNGKT